jgi:hypothetical protein
MENESAMRLRVAGWYIMVVTASLPGYISQKLPRDSNNGRYVENNAAHLLIASAF